MTTTKTRPTSHPVAEVPEPEPLTVTADLLRGVLNLWEGRLVLVCLADGRQCVMATGGRAGETLATPADVVAMRRTFGTLEAAAEHLQDALRWAASR